MAELAPQDLIDSLRKPEVLYTEDFLNDPIKIETDERFHPETILEQLNEIPIINRDGANFGVVDIASTGSVYYPIHMYTPLYSPSSIFKHIENIFTEFV